MNNEKEFQLMRLMVLTSSKNFSSSYVYALDRKVYPYLHETDFHLPFEDHFDLKKDEIQNLSEFLDQKWLNKENLSFYDLESQYDARGSSTNWDRIKLLKGCRYLYLLKLFDDNFWKTLCKRGDSPCEAESIIREVDLEDELLA